MRSNSTAVLNIQNQKKSSVVARSFRETFPFTGYNPATEKNYFEIEGKQEEFEAYSTDWRTMVTSFVGLSNRMPSTFKQSDRNIRRQFFGLPEHPIHGFGQYLWHFIKGTFYVLLKPLFVILPTTILSIVKLVTEFPLTVLKNYYHDQSKKYKIGSMEADNASLQYIAASILLFVVRSITSPLKNAQVAFEVGKELAGEYNRKTGIVLGVLFASVSAALTIAAYILIPPLGLKFLTTQALPFIVTHVPSVIANGIMAGIKAIGAAVDVIKPALTLIGNPFHHLVKVIGLASLSVESLGISVIASGLFTVFGLPLTRLKDKQFNRWHGKKAEDEPAVPRHIFGGMRSSQINKDLGAEAPNSNAPSASTYSLPRTGTVYENDKFFVEAAKHRTRAAVAAIADNTGTVNLIQKMLEHDCVDYNDVIITKNSIKIINPTFKNEESSDWYGKLGTKLSKNGVHCSVQEATSSTPVLILRFTSVNLDFSWDKVTPVLLSLLKEKKNQSVDQQRPRF